MLKKVKGYIKPCGKQKCQVKIEKLMFAIMKILEDCKNLPEMKSNICPSDKEKS